MFPVYPRWMEKANSNGAVEGWRLLHLGSANLVDQAPSDHGSAGDREGENDLVPVNILLSRQILTRDPVFVRIQPVDIPIPPRFAVLEAGLGLHLGDKVAAVEIVSATTARGGRSRCEGGCADCEGQKGGWWDRGGDGLGFD